MQNDACLRKTSGMLLPAWGKNLETGVLLPAWGKNLETNALLTFTLPISPKRRTGQYFSWLRPIRAYRGIVHHFGSEHARSHKKKLTLNRPMFGRSMVPTLRFPTMPPI